ncbi:MAG: MFS transporter [Candidatus Nomurabacteria bacterium]|nr:MAG: MFS transporter [Candidatus Nomurabacteria bacterium]
MISVLRKGKYRADKNSNSDGFIKLFISKRLIHGAASALLGIFVPIFLYKVSGELFYVVGAYYALLSLLYVAFLVPGMYVTNRLGFSRSLVLGGVFSVVLYGIMYCLNAENIWSLIVPLTIAIVGFRIFHWVPFHVDFTLFTKSGERGRLISLSFATIAFMGVVGPILAGFIIAKAGYETLFGTAVLLLILATISYAFVPETKTHFDWSWRETWQKFFSKDMRGVVVGEFANGAETIVNVIVWPIFLYEILNGDVFSIGAVSTVVVGVTIVLQLLVGKHLDKDYSTKEKTLRIGSTLYALGWILKIFVLSAVHVFFVGLYHNIVKIFTKTPFSAILYDMSAEQGKYVDEFTVLREIASHFGRAFSLTVISILTFFIPIGWTFVIAAVASIALNFVYRMQNL